jgi:cytochrome c peroxidase
LFHTVDDRLTHFGAISCDSCHPGGNADGTTWHFAEGPRQSPSLTGGILGTEPFHWDQSVPDMAGISDVTIQGRMGGAGLGRNDMNLIGAYLDQLPAPSPPTMAADVDVSHGAELFFSEAVGCTTCHSGANFTDNLTHDVGTGVENPNWGTGAETIAAFATPVLHGLAASAPYLHDGSAKTLEDLVDRLVVTNHMGKGALLTTQDKADLVGFLKTL